MKIANIEFPNECPASCPYGELMRQGSLCHRCPIFNCAGEFKLLEPEEYRSDWAEIFRQYFDQLAEGVVTYPKLPLSRVEQ